VAAPIKTALACTTPSSVIGIGADGLPAAYPVASVGSSAIVERIDNSMSLPLGAIDAATAGTDKIVLSGSIVVSNPKPYAVNGLVHGSVPHVLQIPDKNYSGSMWNRHVVLLEIDTGSGIFRRADAHQQSVRAGDNGNQLVVDPEWFNALDITIPACKSVTVNWRVRYLVLNSTGPNSLPNENMSFTYWEPNVSIMVS
jgi:hypothetical protein